jgi:hypothetical protein
MDEILIGHPPVVTFRVPTALTASYFLFCNFLSLQNPYYARLSFQDCLRTGSPSNVPTTYTICVLAKNAPHLYLIANCISLNGGGRLCTDLTYYSSSQLIDWFVKCKTVNLRNLKRDVGARRRGTDGK